MIKIKIKKVQVRKKKIIQIKKKKKNHQIIIENMSLKKTKILLNSSYLYAQTISILIDIEKRYFSSILKIYIIQKLILKLIYFLFIYQLDIYTAAFFIYFFLAISSIHLKKTDQIKDLLFFSAKYTRYIYCNILYIIEIFLHQYSINNFVFLTKILTEILR